MGNLSSSPKLSSQNHFSDSVNPVLVHTANEKNVTQAKHCISVISNSHLIREALMLLLKNHQSLYPYIYYAGDINTVPQVIPLKKHLVLFDCGMGQDLTISCIQRWRSLNPSPYMVVLEIKYDTDLILGYIESGAHAYALQGASSTDIAQVIEQVYRGTFQCPPEITAKLFERLSQAKNTPQAQEKLPLTRRELEVLHYVAREYSDREIAAQLVVEVRTVKHHIHNVLQKLKARNRWEAAQIALKNCWLDPISS